MNGRRAWAVAAFALVGWLALGGAVCSYAADTLAQRVVILANSDDPDSLRIARHYAEVRGVPANNIVALKLQTTEIMTWRQFVDTLWEPLLDRLVRDQWIDATPSTLTDAVGRKRYSPFGHRIAALVVCRGVPLKIGHDPALYAEAYPYTSRSELRTNSAAVDSELSLLAQPNHAINAFVPNLLFQNDQPSRHIEIQVVKVARLDGPTADDAYALVDRAVEAERAGLMGRAYIDIGDRDPLGNTWLEDAAKQLAALGFDMDVDRAPPTLAATARFDAPVLYFGWYAENLDGPFALPGFRFPPGAIALHIHSNSAITLRSPTTGWAGPFVARGVTATVGNVYEPYLNFTHRPDLLLRALARGATLVDAAYYALPILSWQNVLIGDPLYRPFAVPLEEQLKARGERSSGPVNTSTSYAVIRQAHLLDAQGQAGVASATALLRSAQAATPDLPLSVALAQRLAATLSEGEGVLAALKLPEVIQTSDWALVREAIRLLETNGQPARAVAVWRALLGTSELSRGLRLTWLSEAQKTARAANDPQQAEAWVRELEAVKVHTDPKQ